MTTLYTREKSFASTGNWTPTAISSSLYPSHYTDCINQFLVIPSVLIQHLPTPPTPRTLLLSYMQCMTKNNIDTVWEEIDFRIWLHVTVQRNTSLRRPGSKPWDCHYGKSSESHRADFGSILILTLASVNPIHACLSSEFKPMMRVYVDGRVGGYRGCSWICRRVLIHAAEMNMGRDDYTQHISTEIITTFN
jgi:hypothetical protein